jgi:DNA (cytosine-5)-methyltransferase 1
MNLVSLFSGVGGLDLGFHKAGFRTIWANEHDRTIWSSFRKNFPDTFLDERSITSVPLHDVPECDGIIGGPPCQSWSEAGALRGMDDARGKLFHNFIAILRAKRPKFFLAENVSGMLASRHSQAVADITSAFHESGYQVTMQLYNAVDFCVPQDRKRVFFVGYRSDLGKIFSGLSPILPRLTLRDAIGDIAHLAVPCGEKGRSNYGQCHVPNHEYLTGGFSTIYMSRNRVRSWDEPSFTIQAGGRHAPIHPSAPKMLEVGKNKRVFVAGQEHLYRRLTVRECARVQTFPDSHILDYETLNNGYKMVGNAVPVNMAYAIATQIYKDIC